MCQRKLIKPLFPRSIVRIICLVPESDSMLRVRHLSPRARTPTRATPGSVGYDLTSAISVGLLPGDRALVWTDLAVEPPPGTYGRIAPRSSLAVQHGIDVGAGVVDPDYRGNLGVLLINNGPSPFMVQEGMRVAQLLLERAETPAIEIVLDLSETERGAGGFGSTDSPV